MRYREFITEAQIKGTIIGDLSLRYATNDAGLVIRVYEKDTKNPLGFVKFYKDNGKDLDPQNLWVHDDYRGRGIAKAMYDYLKSEGYRIIRSNNQTSAGSGFWEKYRGEERIWEDKEVLDEMPLPADWDPQQMRQQGTTFKSRLAYALERAKKLGTGSSRVATTIEYQGRPTVLKIAKNQKGLAQNSVEADILSDGYARQLDILIPIIDYDEQNREPTWIHTELAQRVTEKRLCSIIGCGDLMELTSLAKAIAGKLGNTTYSIYCDILRRRGRTEQQIESMTEYANHLVELNNSFDVMLGDLSRAANWGLYQGKPVIIDVGANNNVITQYYSPK